MKNTVYEGSLIFFLEGRIDSSNVETFENELRRESALFGNLDIAFDAADLIYISSAGLRVLLKIKKEIKKPIRVFNVSDDVFDIFEVTGFTDLFKVEKKLRSIYVGSCKKISSALNGEIFQLSDDEMVKIYGEHVPVSEIKKEREYAHTAMVLGVPTLIPYDVVSSERGFGIVFEKAEMTSLSYLLKHNPDRIDLYAAMLARMLKELHSMDIPEGKLPDIKERYRGWISQIDDPEDSMTAVFSNLLDMLPDSTHYVHGDINLNSLMVQNGELLLLDMAGSARGHGIFDLQSLYASLVAMEKKSDGYCRRTYGISSGVCKDFWDKFFRTYMSDRPEEINSMGELLRKYSVLKEKVLTKLESMYSLSQDNATGK